MDRALASGARGRGFEPLRARHNSSWMLNAVSSILSVSGSGPTLVLTLMEYLDLLSFAQNACDDAGIAAAVEYGYDDEGPFIRCVRDQKLPHSMKTQWPRGQIGTDVANLREGDEGRESLRRFPQG